MSFKPLKFQNPFKREHIPDHMREEQLAHVRWRNNAIAAMALSAIFAGLLTPVLWYAATHPFRIQTWNGVLSFFSLVGQGKLLHIHLLFAQSFGPGVFSVIGGTLLAYCSCMFIAILPGGIAALFNPNQNLAFKQGQASWADEEALQAMEKREQVGIKGGFLMALGRWPSGKRKGQMVQMIETLSCLCLAPPGTGKCLGPDELVMMHDGTSRRNADLRVGDLLMGPDGTARTVLQTNWGYGPMYEIIPNKGRSWTCNGDHILSLRCSKAPRNRSVNPKRGDVRFMTVNEWLNLSQEQKAKWKLWRAAVDFPSRQEPDVDPYLIGLILGDGSTVERVQVHTADAEIARYLELQAAEHGVSLRKEAQPQPTNKSSRYIFTAGNGGDPYTKNPICTEIRNYGLHVTTAHKFIPHELKTGSQATRLAVLAGIIDSDGSYDPAGRGYDIVSASKLLIDDVAFVARSLGLAAYPAACQKTCTNNGAVGTYYRAFISGDVSIIPVKLFRRLPDPRRINKEVTNTGFTIRSIGEGPWFGIVLDGDHQFLLDDFTVTHNTAGLVVPTLVSSDNVSFIVNDPKPELWEFTSSYRSEVSHVFMLNWSKTDEPNFVVRFYKNRNTAFWENLRRFQNPEDEAPIEVANALRARGDEYEVKLDENAFKRLRAWLHANDAADVITSEDPVFYPRFNFLSPRLVPPVGPDRDTYLDAIAKTLIPDDNKGGDSYFKNKGRAALTGFFHMLVAKVGDAKDFSGIPANWVGKEPSIPMLSDWMAISQFNATGGKGSEPIDAMTDIVDDDADQNPNQDKMGEWIRKVSSSIQPRPEYSPTSPENLGKSERGFMELVQLVNMADKERSGVLGTMDEALLPFKNAAVKERTSACDFTPDDMRGILDPEIQARTRLDPGHRDFLDRNSDAFRALQADKANWRPVTLYICVNQAEAKAFSNITALLYQVLSRDLLSYGPREINEKTKTQLGPFPVCFMLDEFAKLPKIDAVIEGPDLGRSKKTSYALVAQDFSQIEKAYTKEDVEIITSTTGVKHILPQNNPNTVERIQKMVGQTTIKDRNKSGTEGFSKQANPLAANVSEQTSGVNFLRTEDIAALAPGKNIVIVQGFSNKPMMLDTPMYFKDKALSERVFPGRSRIGPDGKHKRLPDARFYLPKQIYDARQIEHREHMRSTQATAVREDHDRVQMSAYIGGEEVDIHPQRFS